MRAGTSDRYAALFDEKKLKERADDPTGRLRANLELEDPKMND